jgi:cytochrome P450
MPFTNAVLHESLRLSCTVYNALAHCATSEFSVGDYVIPQGTIVIPSLMTVLLDPKHFSNPHEFNPNRFLNSDGEFKPDKHVIAFGVGKRECLGKSLADKEYFWFLTGLLQRFDINPDPDEELPSYQMKDSPQTSMVRSAPAFNIILTSRIEE